MKTYSDTIEQALAMYTETVSPSQEHLQKILSHIPEQIKQEDRRVIRSPYRWLVVSQFVSLCLLLVAVLPGYTSRFDDPDYYFQDTDAQVRTFENQIDQEDYNATLN
jgi:hypothetical protein